MTKKIGEEALKANLALKGLDAWVGDWETTGTHPHVPGKTFHGRASFEWIEGGAFLLMRTEIDEPEIPSGIAVFGSDNATGVLFMLYFDERGVSRKYDVSTAGKVLHWQRKTPDFSQRMTFTMADDGNTFASSGEMSRNGGAWEGDLELAGSRVQV